MYAVVLPECALSTPDESTCAPKRIASHNNKDTGTVTAEVELPGNPIVAGPGGGRGNRDNGNNPSSGGATVILSLMAGDSSAAGDYTATSLKPSATWAQGGSTGDFTWSYPLRLPPSLGGPAPAVQFAYSSQSLDGLTSATNNQASWLGDGFSYQPGFIERHYQSCVDDGHNTGDQCWISNNATLSIPGVVSGELIADAGDDNLFHLTRDDGTRVQRLYDTSLANGDNDGEYWKVTTLDGTQYVFGRNRLPGWTTGNPETNSVSYVPVFGDDAGEPCYNATFANAWCQQAYRWQLDYVVDTHANTMSYWYNRELNHYARNLTATAVSDYVRESTLARIDYGTDNRSGTDTAYTGTAPARVSFTTADRCQTSTGCETHDLEHWPDVPWDRDCASTSTCADHYSPTFWTTKRLAGAVTQVATGSQTWKDVDAWALVVQWLDAAVGDQTKIMWLDTITQTGRNGDAPDITLPSVMFGPTGSIMPNRVNATDGHGSFQRYRVATIANETGGALAIDYSPADCVPGTKMPTAPESNTYRCFPVYWTPPGGSQMASRKTWGQWRGYDQVSTTTGNEGYAGLPELQSLTRYFRGKHGDHLPSGTRTQTYTVNGTSYNDEDWLAGTPYETIVYNGISGPVVTDTFIEPWFSGPTASRTINGVTTSAYAVNTLRTTVHTTRDLGRADRVIVVTNTFTTGADGTPRGRILTVDDQGDISTSTDETCTRFTYARNDTAHIHALLAQVEVDGLACSTTPTAQSQVISVSRTYYDGATSFPTTPTAGEVTKTEQLSTWNSNTANWVWKPAARADYDDHGRATDTWDALDRHTHTAFTPASGAPVTQITVTNPVGWTRGCLDLRRT